MNPSPEQIRAARALLGWLQQRLADVSGVGIMTVKRYEAGEPIRKSSREAVVKALIANRIVFVERGAVIDDVAIETGVAVRVDR